MFNHSLTFDATLWWHQPSFMVRSAGAAASSAPLDPAEAVSNRRTVAELSPLLDDTSHPLQEAATAAHSSFGGRLLHPRCRRERLSGSFLPTAVRLHTSGVLTADHTLRLNMITSTHTPLFNTPLYVQANLYIYMYLFSVNLHLPEI